MSSNTACRFYIFGRMNCVCLAFFTDSAHVTQAKLETKPKSIIQMSKMYHYTQVIYVYIYIYIYIYMCVCVCMCVCVFCASVGNRKTNDFRSWMHAERLLERSLLTKKKKRKQLNTLSMISFFQNDRKRHSFIGGVCVCVCLTFRNPFRDGSTEMKKRKK